MRTLVLLTLMMSLGSGLLACSTTDASPTDASTDRESGVDLCDVDAFTGNGNPCPNVATRVCFKLCANGGCKCVQGASGPVWSCVNDFSCFADASPLDDSGSEAGSDATIDAGSD